MTEVHPNRTEACDCHCERRLVGKVNAEECHEIKVLFERKNGLLELVRSLGSESISENLYEKIVTDLGQVTTRFNQWWEKMSLKYAWENLAGYRWEIDFETGNIFINKNQ